jgi:hypothetical protein
MREDGDGVCYKLVRGMRDERGGCMIMDAGYLILDTESPNVI